MSDDNTTHHLLPKTDGRMVCRYCGKSRRQLVALHGEEDVTQFPCPDVPGAPKRCPRCKTPADQAPGRPTGDPYAGCPTCGACL